MAPASEPTQLLQYDTLYETDPRHVAVDAYVNSHLLSESKNRYHSALQRIHQNSLDAGLPDIACSPSQAKFLTLQIQMSNAKNVLELGTLGGYSAAWMASAGPDVKVTTIEIDERVASVASRNVAEAGLGAQVEILQGAGLDVLPQLVSQVQSQQRQPFDFVFIDANKQDNLAYFNFAVSMTRPRTAIIVDNVVRNGKVASASETEKDDRVLGTRQLIEAIGKDGRVDATVIQTVGEKNYDGFLIALKK
ncbi:O-methyltransferase-domain-containing protein [Ilyonectria robusta]|uniref:O-methyltransferase-domain-containing protein n=1 Tax=Ilyonectria robusta TaxID=1079257 RepID=UPI001E8DF8C9|nr:O-methyltransferase-domain-containing protein [Ilyonectria robusta]KAH8662759.1 O-methyltransferase-domain-containing protein [Ilyonectria robusta]